jgi:tryptophanyl-tRNA synthetase
VFDYLEIFDNDKTEVEEFKTLYRAGKIGDVDLKSRLADRLNLYLEPLRDRRQQLSKDPDYLKEVLYEGTQKARIMAELTLGEVQQRMGLPIRLSVRSS